MLMKNEVVEMVVRVLEEEEFDDMYREEPMQVILEDVSFDSIIETLVYNEAEHILEQLNNYNPYNFYDVVYVQGRDTFALITEQY